MLNYKLILKDMVIKMEIALLVISVILIVLVLLQSNKASAGGQIITGGNAELFQKTKERGAELFITRLTMVLSIAFMVIAFIIYIS